METIEIFRLQIDLDAAVEQTSELKANADSLKSTLDALKKSGDTNSETYVRLKGELDATNKEYRASQKQIQQMITLQGKEIATVDDARTALSLVSKEWSRQAKLYGVNSKEVDALGKKKLELTNRLKELEASTGDTSRNVGNYTESIGKALGQNTIFTRTINTVKQALGPAKQLFAALKIEILAVASSYRTASAASAQFTGTQKAVAVATNLTTTALKLLRVALISTGIGAIVVALGSLIAFLTKTQRGIDFVSKAMAGLGSFTSVIVDRLSGLFEALKKIFSGDIINGLNDLRNSFSGVGEEIRREVAAAVELEGALQRLKDQEIGLITTQAARKKSIEELRLAAKDELTDLTERANLLKQAGDLEKAVLADELAIAKERARISQEQLDLGESTREEFEENAKLQARVIELETQSLKLQRSIEAERQGLLKRARAEQAANAKAAIAERKKAQDAAIKENETLLKLFIEQNKDRAKSLEDGLFTLQVVLDQELATLKQKLDAEKITRVEFELGVLQAKNKFLEAETQLTVDFAQKELDAIVAKNQSRIEQGQLLTDALVSEEQRRLDLILEKQKEFEAKRLEQGAISQEEYNARINEIDEQNRQQKAELQQELDAQAAERDAINFENEQALRVERDGLVFEARLAELERIRQAELKDAEKKGADLTKVDAKFAVLRQRIKEEETSAKLRAQNELFGGIATLLGRETAAGKAAGIAQATINTFQGVTEVWRNKSVLPEPLATVNKVVQTGVVLGSGLAAVQKIASTNTSIPRGAKGLTMEGRSHSQGGEGIFDRHGRQLAEIEGGENVYVINKRASRLINSLSAVNQATGGIPLSRATRYGVSGGLIQQSIAASTSPSQRAANPVDPVAIGQEVGKNVGEQIQNLNLQVAVTDINDGQSNFAEVVDGASR